MNQKKSSPDQQGAEQEHDQEIAHRFFLEVEQGPVGVDPDGKSRFSGIVAEQAVDMIRKLLLSLK